MGQTDSLDTLSQATELADNFTLIIIVLVVVVVVAILVWLIFRKIPLKVNNRNIVSEPKSETSERKPIIPKVEIKTTATPKPKEQAPTLKKEETKKQTSKSEQKGEPKISVPPPPPPKVEPPAHETSKPKFIGYTPINLFEQTEPLKFPYVVMPKPNCVIKFPQKGRSGRKGYKEEDFKSYLIKYFKSSFQLFDNRFILVKGSNSPYEPDFTLIDEKGGINIFLDVEIDEPYEGINDISRRKATHFQYSDTNRNNAFKNRGWIVIRFAEIQIHQNPNGCCLFVADVVANIHSQFKIQTELLSGQRITSIPQWTKEDAEKMSREKYRERYLGIDNFGFVPNNSQTTAIETELGKETEDIVKDEPQIIIPAAVQSTTNNIYDTIRKTIRNHHFLSFIYNGTPTIVKPLTFNNGKLIAYCYIKNSERDFTGANIFNPIIKQRPFTLEATGPNLGLDRIISVVNTAIQYHKFIRLRYTRSAWTAMQIDEETGEVILDVTEAEESTRTINNVQLAINALDQEHLTRYNLNENYITAYCNRREEQRVFRFDRISELAILDL